MSKNSDLWRKTMNKYEIEHEGMKVTVELSWQTIEKIVQYELMMAKKDLQELLRDYEDGERALFPWHVQQMKEYAEIFEKAVKAFIDRHFHEKG